MAYNCYNKFEQTVSDGFFFLFIVLLSPVWLPILIVCGLAYVSFWVPCWLVGRLVYLLGGLNKWDRDNSGRYGRVKG